MTSDRPLTWLFVNLCLGQLVVQAGVHCYVWDRDAIALFRAGVYWRQRTTAALDVTVDKLFLQENRRAWLHPAWRLEAFGRVLVDHLPVLKA